MKQINKLGLLAYLLLTLFLQFAGSMAAQSWHPFPAGNSLTYSFSQNGSSDTWFLEAAFDSVRLEGQDTAYYFYRIDRSILPTDTGTTCYGQDIQQFPTLYRVNQDHFMGRKMTYRPNGECSFVSSVGDTFLLKTQAQSGNSWNWTNAVTATVDSVVLGIVLGQSDSLKYIRLGSGQTWVLSKAHGLVQATNLLPFPDLTGATVTIQLTLAGIPAAGLGVSLPGYAEIFQFDPADRFGYEHNEGYQLGSRTDFLEYNVQSQTPASQFNYQTTLERFVINRPIQAAIDSTYFPPVPHNWSFDSVSYPFLNLKPYQHRMIVSSVNGAAVQAGVHTMATMNGRMVKEFDLLEMYDSCANVYTTSVTTGNQRFGEGLGELYYFLGNVQTAHIRELYAYEKGTETWGNFRELSTLLAVESGFEGQLSIFPNPAQDGIQIQVPSEFRGNSKVLKLWAMDGRLIKTETMAADQTWQQMELADLNPGMYILSVEENGNKIAQRRIAIQR
ncbi:MAG: T9SS type A sorting domain-containing protein [Bacteroidetes bacterium]|nr:T9SS type A sorting domain-containing protein [Bacteroidota bacterium]